MGRQYGVKGIRHKSIYVLRIGLMHVYLWIYFYYLLLFIIHVLLLDSLGIGLCILVWVWYVASQLNYYMYVRLYVSQLGSDFLISNLPTTVSHVWPHNNSHLPWDPITCYQRRLSIYTIHFQLVRRPQPKWCSESHIVSFPLNMHFCEFNQL